MYVQKYERRVEEARKHNDLLTYGVHAFCHITDIMIAWDITRFKWRMFGFVFGDNVL